MDPLRVVQRGTGPPAAQRVGPDKNGHRPIVPGDRDLLTILDAGQQLGGRSPGLGNGDRCHDRNCTFLYIGGEQRGTEPRPEPLWAASPPTLSAGPGRRTSAAVDHGLVL